MNFTGFEAMYERSKEKKDSFLLTLIYKRWEKNRYDLLGFFPTLIKVSVLRAVKQYFFGNQIIKIFFRI